MTVLQPMGRSYGPTTDAGFKAKLEAVASDLPDQAVVHRIALGDIVYPRTAAENTAMAGWTVVLITCLTHDPSELPLGQVVARTAAGDLPLQRAALKRSRFKDARLARVFGQVRTDELYYIPVFMTRVPTVVVADFAKNRKGLEVMKFPPEPEVDAFPPGISIIEDVGSPDVEVATKLAKEEFGW